MNSESKGCMSPAERVWISGIAVLGALILMPFFTIAKIGRFEFRLLDYFTDRDTFLNGIQWFTGWGEPTEKAMTYAYLILIALLAVPLTLQIIAWIRLYKPKSAATPFLGAGLCISALIPILLIVSVTIINAVSKTAELTIYSFLALFITFIPALLYFAFSRFAQRRFVRRLYREKTLWLISAVALSWLLVFAYVPMAGIATAFFNYKPGMAFTEMPFVGLRFFREFFMLPDFMKILRNTLVISGLNLTIGFAAPIIFALLLNELRSVKFKRTVQTISYMPYFVSWVVVASIMTVLLNSDGLLNEVLLSLGVIDTPISYLNNPQLFWWVQLIANIWKNVGWGSIIYLAAIAGVDQELYQAGAVDGLGRFGRIWHVTLPGIRTTVILLFILGIGNLFNTGFEYQLLLGTPLTRDVHEVVDTYVYRFGIQQGRYSFATAVGLMKSIIGFILVLVTNSVAKKVSDVTIM